MARSRPFREAHGWRASIRRAQDRRIHLETKCSLVAGFLLLDSYSNLSIGTQIALWSAFGIAFPLFFFRYSRSLWLSIDYVFNPEAPELREVR